jgi:hypothetical protein
VATIFYQFDAQCAGGGHTDVMISINSGPLQERQFMTDEIRAPLSQLTEEERDNLLLSIAKVHFAGKTRAQVRAELEAGFTVTI